MAGALQTIAEMRERVARMGVKLTECREIADKLEVEPAMDSELEGLIKQLVAWWEAREGESL